MRLWSLHPCLIPNVGNKKYFNALWKEGITGLTALKELEKGNRVGYSNHSQLTRFKNTSDPVRYLSNYLFWVHLESVIRNYNFNLSLIEPLKNPPKIPVTKGQYLYELEHLRKKLETTNYKFAYPKCILLNPLFYLVDGAIEVWEKVK